MILRINLFWKGDIRNYIWFAPSHWQPTVLSHIHEQYLFWKGVYNSVCYVDRVNCKPLASWCRWQVQKGTRLSCLHLTKLYSVTYMQRKIMERFFGAGRRRKKSAWLLGFGCHFLSRCHSILTRARWYLDSMTKIEEMSRKNIV